MASQIDPPPELYRALFLAVPTPCLLLRADPDFTIVDVNTAYLDETVSERRDLIGRPVFQAFPDNPAAPDTNAAESLGDSLRRVMRTGRHDVMALQKYDVPDRNGATGRFLERVWRPINVPVFADDGALRYILHRVENVTDFVNEVLDATGDGRDDAAPRATQAAAACETADIARSRQLGVVNAELRRVNQEALALATRLKEESSRKDEFLAMLGHELRNPLAGLASAFELIHRSDAQAVVPSAFPALIKRQIGSLTRLVDDLLDASRVSRGAIRLKQDPLDLRMVVETSAYAVRRDFERKRHTLTINISPADYTLVGDDTRLQQIVANLLSNAIKYTDAGGSIEVALTVEQRNARRFAILSVTDSGRGIAPADLETIFELFAQVNATLEHAEGGLGIGLSLARRLVELHGGALSAQSAGGGMGSRFTVELPLTDAAMIEAAPAKPLRGCVPAHSVSVLLVEDNSDVSVATAAMLEGFGYVVTTESNGPDGLKAIQGQRPMVAIVDIGLPGMNGFEVASEARRSLGDDCPYLIALSGYSGPDVVDMAKESGFDCALVKPVDIPLLQRTIDEAASNRDRTSSASLDSRAKDGCADNG